VNRRALIVADVAFACLFVVGGVTILVLQVPASVVAGISALAIGSACAITTVLFIAAGGWSRERARLPDTNRRAYAPRGERTPEQQ
jgi:membrane protein implicated in regulation of membrane protease activity